MTRFPMGYTEAERQRDGVSAEEYGRYHFEWMEKFDAAGGVHWVDEAGHQWFVPDWEQLLETDNG